VDISSHELSVKTAPTFELELLLLCARARLEDRQPAAIFNVLNRDLDWESFISHAQRHGVTALVYRTLASLNPIQIPDRVRERLRFLHDANRLRNLVLVAEMHKALKALDLAGITATPYKGPALAAALYGDFSVRQSMDIDVFVKPRDAVKAYRALADLGYVPLRRVPGCAQEAYTRLHYEFGFVSRDEKQLIVELHWRTSSRYFRFPELPALAWERRVWLPVAGTNVRSFAPEDLLYVLCLHGCRHKWRSLKWIVDVAELVRTHSQLDWWKVLSDARRNGSERMLALGLFLACDLLDARLPAELLHAIRRKPLLNSLANEVYANLFKIQSEPGSALFILPFIARVAERLDAKLLCRALLLPYFLLHRIVRPSLGALRRSSRF
jgi:hypothetical protein